MVQTWAGLRKIEMRRGRSPGANIVPSLGQEDPKPADKGDKCTYLKGLDNFLSLPIL